MEILIPILLGTAAFVAGYLSICIFGWGSMYVLYKLIGLSDPVDIYLSCCLDETDFDKSCHFKKAYYHFGSFITGLMIGLALMLIGLFTYQLGKEVLMPLFFT